MWSRGGRGELLVELALIVLLLDTKGGTEKPTFDEGINGDAEIECRLSFMVLSVLEMSATTESGKEGELLLRRVSFLDSAAESLFLKDVNRCANGSDIATNRFLQPTSFSQTQCYF